MSGLNESDPSSSFWEQRLSNWIQEWNLRNEMLKDGPPTDSTKNPGENLNAASLVNFSDEPIQAGDIRILRSRLIGETDLPVYVAVISEWEDGDWLIAPYGEFSEPATTGELLTGREDFGLRVLCLWNAHTISSEDLMFSFFEDSMTDEERKDSWEVFRGVSTGDDLPEHLSKRIGPPIVHPKDPRIAYQEECKEMMTPLRKRWTEQWNTFDVFENDECAIDFESDIANQQEYGQLAASESPTASQQIYSIQDSNYTLLVQFSKDSGEIFFSVENDSEAVEELDGYSIIVKSIEGKKYSLEGGQLIIPIDGKTVEFNLIDKSGIVRNLTRID